VIALVAAAGVRLYFTGGLTVALVTLLGGPLLCAYRAHALSGSMNPEAASEAFHGAIVAAVVLMLSVAILA
jgi:hypothetical protein